MCTKRTFQSLSFFWGVFLISSITAQAAPVGVEFDLSTLTRVRHIGDNWCQTWAADDSVITAMDDGNWIANTGPPVYHSMLYKIMGDADSFTRSRVEGYPNFDRDGDGWFAYGVVSVDGVLYSLVSKTQGTGWATGPFRGMKLLRSYSDELGDKWYRVNKNDEDFLLSSAAPPTNPRTTRELLTDDEMFFFEEYGRLGKGKTAYPFSYAAFVQNGKDNSASQDGYVYIYSPEGANSHELLLARVPANQVGLRSAWEYFSGWNNDIAQWSTDIEARQPNLLLPEQNSSGEYFGWYSWLPSVVWNPGLQLYVMVNGGTYAGDGLSNSTADYYDRWMHTKTGSLGLWYSENPYGPWQQFYYTDYWTVDDPDNLTYQPKLSPKWISDDGKKMTLIWSDAMRDAQGNSHNVNYTWNQIEIDILIEEDPDIPVEFCNGEEVTVNMAFGQSPTSNADVILGTPDADTITAMGGDDTICALGGNDIISGGNGNDWIDAGLGDDTVDGGNNDDTIFGNEGIDTLNGGPGDDDISGEDDGDFIKGNSGNDTLDGGDGIDQIIAGSGNDTITTGSGGNLGTGLLVDGGAGDDNITGGSGDDSIRGATGNDTILGGSGNDALFGGGGNDSVNGQDGDDLIKGNGSKDTLIGGNGNDEMDGGGSDDVMDGGNGDDIMRGSTGNDDMQGGAGNDEMFGGGGNDVLNGDDGDDKLYGGGSNDTLIGGIDVDVCDGEAGTDTATSCETITSVP